MPGDSLKNIIPIIKYQKEETTFNYVLQKLKNEISLKIIHPLKNRVHMVFLKEKQKISYI